MSDTPEQIEARIAEIEAECGGPVYRPPVTWLINQLRTALAKNAKLRAQRDGLVDSLAEILDYRGGPDNPLEDQYVMERAEDAIAAAKETPDAD